MGWCVCTWKEGEVAIMEHGAKYYLNTLLESLVGSQVLLASLSTYLSTSLSITMLLVVGRFIGGSPIQAPI